MICRIFVAAFLVFYGICAHVLLPSWDLREVYPFFDWAMFSRPVDTINDYAIEIVEENGSCMVPECPRISRKTDFVRLYFLIQRLGYENQIALKDERPFRLLFEKHFLSPPYQYRLIHRKYDPIQYSLRGQLQARELAVFSSEDRQ